MSIEAPSISTKVPFALAGNPKKLSKKATKEAVKDLWGICSLKKKKYAKLSMKQRIRNKKIVYKIYFVDPSCPLRYLNSLFLPIYATV